MITYQEEQINDGLIEEIKPLLEKHWQEVALHKDKIQFDPDYEKYKVLCDAGVMKAFTARDSDDNELIGYFVVVITPHLHYKSTIYAMNDIIYVKPDRRGGIIAYKLIQFVERELKEKHGVSVIVINMKMVNLFDRLLGKLGFSNTEQIFSKYIGG